MSPDTTNVIVRESARARRITLRALPSGIEVVVPRGTPRHHVDRAVTDAGPWIARVQTRRDRAPTLGLGRPGVLWRHGNPELNAAPTTRAVIEQYRSITRSFLDFSVPSTAAGMGVAPRSWTVRSATTRWGSCTHARQTLSFNWRLSLVPIDIAQHVVIHELAHLRHPNHGPSFWRLVGETDARTRERRAWLRAHGAEVMGYDPAVAIR